jgi:hypothetical protein
MRLPQFTIRDLLWLMVVVALAAVLWAERASIKRERASLEKERLALKADQDDVRIKQRQLIDVFKRVAPGEQQAGKSK